MIKLSGWSLVALCLALGVGLAFKHIYPLVELHGALYALFALCGAILAAILRAIWPAAGKQEDA